jgi:hypothetical protein
LAFTNKEKIWVEKCESTFFRDQKRIEDKNGECPSLKKKQIYELYRKWMINVINFKLIFIIFQIFSHKVNNFYFTFSSNSKGNSLKVYKTFSKRKLSHYLIVII